MIIRGGLIILAAAFVWGIGNAITGITAQKYLFASTLLPAVEIALANTIGGLCFLGIVYAINKTTRSSSPPRSNPHNTLKGSQRLKSKRSILAGALKGTNTCLFVFSTTYIAATQSLVLESTYIVWSLLLTIFILARRMSLLFSLLKTVVLLLGVLLVTGEVSFEINTIGSFLGVVFGILAGLSYALFLFFWSGVTENLDNLKEHIKYTGALLGISLLTILLMTEIIFAIFHSGLWVPFTSLQIEDLALQLANGVFVVGIVYLLITIGLGYLKNVRQGAGFVVALGLSFAIPFTLLPEFIIGKFLPGTQQLFGFLLFMVGFIFLSVSISRDHRNAEVT